MNATSVSRGDTARDGRAARIVVWDAPVRLFHWLIVLCFAGAWLTADSEHWRLVHVTFGYTMAGLVAFRLLWGVVGTRHARFSSFVRGPRAALRYLGSIARRRPEHYTGHNPAGALAIVALLVLAVAVTASGWAAYAYLGDSAEDLHEGAANAMLLLVGIHVAGVLVSSWLHRQNLVKAMITGRKPGAAEEGIRRTWRGLALVMLAAVLGFWWLEWQSAPTGLDLAPLAATPTAIVREPGREGDDD